ncbi:ABC transporter [Actinomyces sp. 2119]|uniref:Lipoprotein n=1 Tax=Actinomyces lilanjuaniae TaxID=2321394 RepID=A0ABM6Z606_9ACTO|nr:MULTISPECIES: MetQ/NlpA family ABC transporter substrate-binding protein [Actinomyces]AYD90587.1 ABC transporter [Actinomyces lilanjuaniae]RJF43960.1 ABC transporter [Actinomyces sp. 2119]
MSSVSPVSARRRVATAPGRSVGLTRRAFSTGLVVAVGATLAACSSSSGPIPGTEQQGDDVVISIGATPVPHVQILQYVQDNLVEGSGISLDIVEINDYQTPNTSLNDGDLAANFYQTPNFLEQQIDEKGYDFVSIADVHIEPLGLYSSKYTSVDDLPEGGLILINSDPANAARGLQLLADNGLIELDESVEMPSANDVTSNPSGFEFETVDGAQTAASMPDAAAAVINGNYAIDAGLAPNEDSLLLETAEGSPHVNQLVVRAGDREEASLQKLAELLNHDDVRAFIEENWSDGSVLPAF